MYYRYSVLSETGNEIHGLEEGILADIKNKLQQKNFYILALEPDLIKTAKSIVGKKQIKSQVLSVFFEDMMNMLKTGIALKEAVIALEESSTNPILTKALSHINDNLAMGFSLTGAFEKTNVFPILVLNTLKVGEKSGSLEQIFSDLSVHYSREASFMRSLRNATFYPLVVFCLLIGIMFYVSFKVIPHLGGLISVQENIGFATRLLLFLSAFLKKFWFICFVFPIVLLVVYSRLKKSKVDKVASFYYKIPVLGAMVKDIAFSAFFSNLAILQKSGIGIVEGLVLIRETTPFNFLAKKASKLNDLVLSGLSFWQALEKDPFFPSFVYYAVRKGEEMGRLDDYLYSLSRYYFDKVDRQLRTLLDFIQPVLLIFCAAFLLLIVSAFIVPIYSNLSNIAGGNIKF